MAVILELNQIERAYQAIRRVSGNQINLPVCQRAISKRQIHLARRGAETQTVGARETGITIGARHEVLPEARTPVDCARNCIRDGFQSESSSIIAAHKNRESILETKRRPHLDLEFFRIVALYGIINRPRVGVERIFEDCHIRRPGIFRVAVDLAGHKRFMRDIARQLKLTNYRHPARFQ